MENLADLFSALGEKGRLKIIKFLTEGEKCVCEIIEEFELSQAAISHHLRVLRQVGLVKVRREGRWGYYSLDREGFAALERLLKEEIFQPVSDIAEENSTSQITSQRN